MNRDATAQWVEIAGQQFLLRDVTPTDRDAVLTLHHEVFGSKVDASWYDWKYRRGGGEAAGLWLGDRLVAHCAGTPRQVLHQGRLRQDLQIGDVMVAPQWRGVLTRRSPFFRVSKHFYDSRLGADKDHEVGFGFPNERHLRLAVKMGLSWDGGPMESLQWDGNMLKQTKLPWHWRLEALDPAAPGFERLADSCWQAMRSSRELDGFSAGVRDAAYLRWRFVERPDRRYQFWALRRPWSRQATGLLVLDDAANPGSWRLWLDWIGPPGLLPLACQASRIAAAGQGAAGLTAWASPALSAALESSGITGRCTAAVLGIPHASDLAPVDVPKLHWWFMAGDTDFL